MGEWKRICCAVDFSRASRAALTQAAELARRLGAELSIVHVYEAPVVSALDALTAAPEAYELQARELERAIASWQADAQAVTGRPVEVFVLTGSAAGEIVRFAREHGVDAIVVATHGRTGLPRVVLGSVAEHVVRTAPCAVVVARAAADSQ